MGTALVTGGAGGIGAAIVAALLAAGHEVIVLDRDPPAPQPGVTGWQADLTDAAATASVLTAILGDRTIDILIHNAGAIRPAAVPDISTEDVAALSQLHLGAAIQLAQAVLPGMRAAGQGRIVLLASRAALGLAGRSLYAATKAGIIGLARSWALEFARDGITVNAVAPGPIGGTAMFEQMIPPGSPQETALARAIPVQRLGTPDDVARAVLFFTNPASSFITGQSLFVCGGASVGQAPV